MEYLLLKLFLSEFILLIAIHYKYENISFCSINDVIEEYKICIEQLIAL